MIPGKIIAGEETLQFNIPTNWSEVTFWQLAQLSKPDTTALEELSILSGVEHRIWSDVSAKDAQAWSIKLQTALLSEQMPDWAALPPVFRFKLGYKFIELPKEIGKAPAGAVETIRSILRQHQKPDSEAMDIPTEDLILCFALLCVKPFHGNYGEDGEEKANSLSKLVKELPAVVAYPTINFFFNVWKKKPKVGTNDWQGLLKILTWRRGSKDLINSAI